MSRQVQRTCIIFILGSLLSLGVSPALGEDASGELVSEIRVQGNETTSTSAVLTRIRTRVEAPYDETVIREDERRLLNTGRFKSVVATKTSTPKGVIVIFLVVERPLVDGITFKGNKAYDAEDLAGDLLFSEASPLNQFNIEAGRQAMLTRYRSEGYHFASVEVDKGEMETHRRVVYRIVEGPQVYVRSIRFEGRKYFSHIKLRQLVGVSRRYWPIIDGHIDIDQIDRDVLNLRSLYLDKGFLDVQVGRLIDFSADKTSAIVTFVIDEGPRFRVDKIFFEGNTVFSGDELARRMRLGQGEFLTSEDLQSDIKAIKATYGEMGYVDARVESAKRFRAPSAEVPPWAVGLEDASALLDLVIRVRENDQYRVGNVDVRGNTITQSRVIRRELRFYPEQLLNSEAVEESRSRLMGTRLFDDVKITPLAADSTAVRDVLVQIEEARTAEFVVGAGFNSNAGLIGTVSVTERNFDIFNWPTSWDELFNGRAFRGAGQTMKIVAEPGLDVMRFHIDWFEPALFDKPYSLGTKVFAFMRERESYDEERYGGVISVGHRFRNRWYGEVSTRLESVRVGIIDTDDSPSELLDDAGTALLAGPKFTLVRDRTDSRWKPSDGDRFRISYEHILGGYEFGRIVGDYRIYRTLYVDAIDRKHVIAARISSGAIFGDAPIYERFYGGGIGSVRGFDYRGISPRSMDANNDDPIGGDFMFFLGAEYGFPLVGDQLRGVVFIDSGTVERNFEITTYRASAGVGLRWILPMMGDVPLSLDIAFPLNKNKDDETQLVSFTIGWTF